MLQQSIQPFSFSLSSTLIRFPNTVPYSPFPLRGRFQHPTGHRRTGRTAVHPFPSTDQSGHISHHIVFTEKITLFAHLTVKDGPLQMHFSGQPRLPQWKQPDPDKLESFPAHRGAAVSGRRRAFPHLVGANTPTLNEPLFSHRQDSSLPTGCNQPLGTFAFIIANQSTSPETKPSRLPLLATALAAR